MDSVRFSLELCVNNSAYIHHLNILLREWGYCSNVTKKLVAKSESFQDKRLDRSITRFNYRLTTFTFTSLLWIYEGFYPVVYGKNTKWVPAWMGANYNTSGLALWIMQDGTRQIKQGVNLATNILNIPFRNPDGFPRKGIVLHTMIVFIWEKLFKRNITLKLAS